MKLGADSAARSGRAWALLGLVFAIGLASDLWSKYWAFANIAPTPVVVDREQILQIARERGASAIGMVIPQHEPMIVVPGLLDFTLVLNPGAVFGMGPGKRWFFMSFTLVAILGGIALFSFGTRARQWVSHLAIGLVLSGGVGNFYDRLFYGCVRDFIHPLPGVKFPFGWQIWGKSGEVWPYVSNVADLWLIVGVVILMCVLWKQDGQARATAKG
jgi:signal peptidase II